MSVPHEIVLSNACAYVVPSAKPVRYLRAEIESFLYPTTEMEAVEPETFEEAVAAQRTVEG